MHGRTTPIKLCKTKELRAPVEVEGKLSEHGIDNIFNDRGESRPFRSIVQMAEAEVLFNDIAFFGYFLVSFDFILS